MLANSLSIGDVIKYNNGYWRLTKKEHVKPGKGGAYVQAELKNITTGTKTNERFRSSDEVEKAFMDDKTYQYQYDEGDTIAVMNNETFEQESFSKELLGDKLPFLQDEMMIRIFFCEGTPIDIKLPDTVILEIKETEPSIKGQTVTNSFKPAILENGIRVMVPPFVNSGEKIVVRTEDATYVERAK